MKRDKKVNKTRPDKVKWSEEEKFIEALKKGDERAYEIFYYEYAPKIGAIAKSYLGYDDVEDVIQEVMMRVYKGIKKFRGDSKLSTWVHRIAVNVCKDHLEKKKRRREVLTSFPEDDEEEHVVDHPSVESHVLEEALNELDHERIVNLMNKLSEEDRLLIKLRDIDGKSYEEIAEILGKPIGTVKSRLHYARKKLRRLMEGGMKDVERKDK